MDDRRDDLSTIRFAVVDLASDDRLKLLLGRLDRIEERTAKLAVPAWFAVALLAVLVVDALSR